MSTLSVWFKPRLPRRFLVVVSVPLHGARLSYVLLQSQKYCLGVQPPWSCRGGEWRQGASGHPDFYKQPTGNHRIYIGCILILQATWQTTHFAEHTCMHLVGLLLVKWGPTCLAFTTQTNQKHEKSTAVTVHYRKCFPFTPDMCGQPSWKIVFLDYCTFKTSLIKGRPNANIGLHLIWFKGGVQVSILGRTYLLCYVWIAMDM